ncbi:MAG: secretin N-terminal domain-containing protein [Planctomycetota bacterium]|jgi:type IV pilus assembly protein PilQ
METTGIQGKMTVVLMVLACVLTAFGAEEAGSEWTKPELLTPVQQRMQQEISIDFRDTAIDDVLMIMAKQADVDIIKSPRVAGTVTATLTDIPLAEALSNILEAHGYTYLATDNMIRVVPKDEVLEVREKIASRVYRITYADVKQVEEAIKKFISERGSVSASISSSNIIVTDVESKIAAIDSFISEIDRVTPQIMVESKIYDISSQDNMDLGVDWQAGTSTSYGPPTDGTYGNDIFNLGNVLQSTSSDPHSTGAFSGKTGKADSEAMIRFGVLNDHINVDFALYAAQEDITAKLLANPRIMVLDNEQAEIKIIEEIPYQELTESSAGGSIGTTAFRDVGVELRVTPHLTRDGMIRMVLNPKFSVVTGQVVIQGTNGTSPQPIVASREETTTALIKDGQTVVIGGLKKQDVSAQINKVPLLGDLPLLGGLFRFEGESTTNSELVIFITPHLINEPALTPEEQDILDNMQFVSPRHSKTKLGKADLNTMDEDNPAL